MIAIEVVQRANIRNRLREAFRQPAISFTLFLRQFKRCFRLVRCWRRQRRRDAVLAHGTVVCFVILIDPDSESEWSIGEHTERLLESRNNSLLEPLVFRFVLDAGLLSNIVGGQPRLRFQIVDGLLLS